MSLTTGRGAVIISQTQQMNRMAGPPHGMVQPLHPQYGMQRGYATGYSHPAQYAGPPGVVHPPPHQSAFPPPPNYQQATQQGQSVTVSTVGTADPGVF